MAVELRTGSVVWPVGTPGFLHAFFSTIAARLEPDGWGSRFPAVMKTLYGGEIGGEDASRAVAELDQIRAELREHPPADVVWDYEDRGSVRRGATRSPTPSPTSATTSSPRTARTSSTCSRRPWATPPARSTRS